MTRDERIEISLDIAKRRLCRLRRFTEVGAPDAIIARELHLAVLAIGNGAAILAMPAAPPPLVDIGQGTSRRKWPEQENSDD